MMRVGLLRLAMVLAMAVKVLPVPVAPRRTCMGRPAANPAVSSAMAFG